MEGYIHSIETLGALDGPGLRTVIFMQGCPLKCQFCHNIDCTIKQKGTKFSPKDLAKKVLSNKAYWGETGGITISGGEPTFQEEFLLEFVKIIKKERVNIAIDTCLITSSKFIETLLPYIDLWMVSIKHMDDIIHKNLTGPGNKKILENIIILDELLTNSSQQFRIRFLVIPGITDGKENIVALGEFLSKLKSNILVELLAYKEYGKYKWIELFGQYKLEGKTREANRKDLEKVASVLKTRYKLNVTY